MAEKELAILISARDTASRTLKSVSKEVGGLKGAVKTAGKGVSALGHNLTLLGAGVVAGLGLAVRSGIESLSELDDVVTETAAALKSTAGVSGQTEASIRAMSEALEDLTTVDDKTIQKSANLMLAFTNVRDEAFEPALEAALDLSAGLKIDLFAATKMVGKALQDPTKGLTALRKAGVMFSADETKVIKSLVDTGKAGEAQELILAKITQLYGGRAAAAADTYAGKMRRLDDAFEDTKMTLARAFLPILEKVAGKLSTALASPKVQKSVEELGSALAGAFDKALALAEQIPWDSVADAMKLAGQGAKAALDMFLQMPPWVQTAIVTGWGLNKLTGGALGSIVGELGKGLIKGVLGMNAGVVNINAGVVNGLGGVGGVAGAAGKGGGIGGMLKTGLKLILPAAVLAEALNLANEQVVLPMLQGQAETNIANAEVQLKAGSLDELKTALAGLQDIPKHLDLVGKLLYDNNAYGVKAHNEAMQQAYAAEINRRSGQTALEAILGPIGTGIERRLDLLKLAGTGQIGLLRASLAAQAGTRAVTSTVAAATGRVATMTAGVKAATSAGLSAVRAAAATTTSAINAKNFSPRITVPVRVTTNLSIRTILSATAIANQYRTLMVVK